MKKGYSYFTFFSFCLGLFLAGNVALCVCSAYAAIPSSCCHEGIDKGSQATQTVEGKCCCSVKPAQELPSSAVSYSYFQSFSQLWDSVSSDGIKRPTFDLFAFRMTGTPPGNFIHPSIRSTVLLI